MSGKNKWKEIKAYGEGGSNFLIVDSELLRVSGILKTKYDYGDSIQLCVLESEELGSERFAVVSSYFKSDA